MPPNPDFLTLGVLVPAAGLGRRMGGVKKQYLELAGEPVLLWALRPFLSHPALQSLVVALPPEDAADPPDWLLEEDARVQTVAGGATRGESVSLALAALPEVDVIMVHDGARPLVTSDTVEACFQAASQGQGVVAGIPAVDTLKRVDAQGAILDTPDRATLWQAHTPQAFPGALLRRAYESAGTAGLPATDDSALVERLGATVFMVRGNSDNIKVTRPDDLILAEAILRDRSAG